jgi:hypothetical protein
MTVHYDRLIFECQLMLVLNNFHNLIMEKFLFAYYYDSSQSNSHLHDQLIAQTKPIRYIDIAKLPVLAYYFRLRRKQKSKKKEQGERMEAKNKARALLKEQNRIRSWMRPNMEEPKAKQPYPFMGRKVLVQQILASYGFVIKSRKRWGKGKAPKLQGGKHLVF